MLLYYGKEAGAREDWIENKNTVTQSSNGILSFGGGDAALEINTEKGKLIRSGKSRQKLCAPVQAMTGSDDVFCL